MRDKTKEPQAQDAVELEAILAPLHIGITGHSNYDQCVRDAIASVNRLLTSARLDSAIAERERVALDNYEGKTFSFRTNWHKEYDKFVKGNYERWCQLQAERNGETSR